MFLRQRGNYSSSKGNNFDFVRDIFVGICVWMVYFAGERRGEEVLEA